MQTDVSPHSGGAIGHYQAPDSTARAEPQAHSIPVGGGRLFSTVMAAVRPPSGPIDSINMTDDDGLEPIEVEDFWGSEQGNPEVDDSVIGIELENETRGDEPPARS